MSTSRSIPPTHVQNVMSVVHQPGGQGLIHQNMASPLLGPRPAHVASKLFPTYLCSPCLRRLHRSRTLSSPQTHHADHSTPSHACLRSRWQHRRPAGQPWFGIAIRSSRWFRSHKYRNDGPPRKPWCFSGQFHHRQSHRGGWQRQCCRRGSFSSPARRDNGLQ